MIKKVFMCLFFIGATAVVAMDPPPRAEAEEITLQDTLNFLKRVVPNKFKADATVEVFAKTYGIAFNNTKFSDEDFQYLVPLCKLGIIQGLYFQFTNVTGAGLSTIKEKCGTWESITQIDLGGSPLVDEHLINLNVFPNLIQLNIDYHQEPGLSLVTGDFLHFLHLDKLRYLEALGTNISDANALTLLNWPSLEGFRLNNKILQEDTLKALREAKIDTKLTNWDLRRMQWSAAQAGEDVGNQGSESLDTALTNKWVTQEAYDWAKINNIGLLLAYSLEDYRPYGVAFAVKVKTSIKE